ncbi:DUF6544 family protein [Hydrogenimonas sp.]
MPPIVKKLIAVLVILVVANAGFVWYGQASFDATFQQLSKAFADNNATLPRRAELPGPIARYIRKSGLEAHGYKTLVMALDGTFRKKAGAKPMPLHALALLRPTPDMLWAAKLDANAVVSFNALESYHAGRAKLQALLFGIVPTGEIAGEAFARSELARVLAYGLYNPALLDCACIDYRELDSRHVEAVIHDGNLSAEVVFETNDAGDIVAVTSRDRVRPVKKSLEPAPWRLEVVAFGERDGLRMPVEAKEVWVAEGEPFVASHYRVASAKRL